MVVIEIQKLLNAAGCNVGVADGIWGRRTQAAAVLFAKTVNLPTTKEELMSETFIQQLRASPANVCPKPPAPFYSSYKYNCTAELSGKLRLSKYNSGTATFVDDAVGIEYRIYNIRQNTAVLSFKKSYNNHSGPGRLERNSVGRITAMSFDIVENFKLKRCYISQ